MKVACKFMSSVIEAITYDIATRELIVHFADGNEYTYPDVPLLLITTWMEAESHGQFFNQHIRPLSP